MTYLYRYMRFSVYYIFFDFRIFLFHGLVRGIPVLIEKPPPLHKRHHSILNSH
jgi:hypothetical protein